MPTNRSSGYRFFILAGIFLLALILLYDAHLVWRNVQLYRQTDQHTLRLQQIDAETRDWQMLIQDLIAFSSREPAIDPILQKYGIKDPSASPQPR